MRAIDGDALSEWMKDYGQKVIKGERKNSLMYIWKHIQDMPTIEPERKTGKWLDDPDGYKCSACGAYFEIECCDGEMNFCPNCGADNRG